MNDVTRRGMFALAGGGFATAALAQVGGVPAARPRVQYVDVNGTRLGYEVHGRAGRRPLVFVHGYALRGTGDVYASLIRQLTSDFRVYALDMRGHGASAASAANWSQAAIADDVAAFVFKLGLRGAVYAGHSLGGFTGMFSQIRHPHTFSAMALLATAVASGGTPPPGLKEAFATKGRDAAFANGAFAPMYVHPGPGDVGRAVAAVGLIPPAVHETFFSNFAANVITERLPEIQVPVLLVNGGRDTVVSPAEQHKTALGLPRSKEVLFAQLGHMLPIEDADATAREMLGFFRHDAGLGRAV